MLVDAGKGLEPQTRKLFEVNRNFIKREGFGHMGWPDQGLGLRFEG